MSYQLKRKVNEINLNVFVDGRYVLMVSMYNRLGGHVLQWSNMKGQRWGGTTLTITHDGNFYNTEIKVSYLEA